MMNDLAASHCSGIGTAHFNRKRYVTNPQQAQSEFESTLFSCGGAAGEAAK
jgi:hypothetical protein